MEKRRIAHIRTTLPAIALAMLLFVVSTGFSGGERDYFARIGAAIDLFSRTFTELNKNYVDPLDPMKLAREAIAGMFAALDPYTVFIDEHNKSEMETLTTGRYAGLGINLSYRNNRAIVNDLLIASDSFGGRLRIGDELIAIDGVDIRGRQEPDIRGLLKGVPGTRVTLRILRPGAAPYDASFERREIPLPTVSYTNTIRDSIGYIKLDRFSAYATDQFRAAVRRLTADARVKGVVIDLRDNPGGLLNASVDIAGMFLPRDSRIVSTLGNNESYSRSYSSRADPICPDLPIAVLVDDGSASATEIVAGAIQDYDRGVIVGERTYGKGLVQNFVTLDDRFSMKITTSRYYTPSGRCIQKAGFAERAKDSVVLGDRRDSSRIFFTLNARRGVRDHGGITPDIELRKDETPDFLADFQKKGCLFDFITLLRNQSPADRAPVFDNTMMARFRRFIDTVATAGDEPEKSLEQLQATAKRDGWPEAFTARLEELKRDVVALRRQLIEKYWDRIKPVLERQYAWHSANAAARFEADLRTDRQLAAAVRVLRNPAEYRKILATNAASR